MRLYYGNRIPVPNEEVVIDWSHPLAAALKSACVGNRDIIDGRLIVPVGYHYGIPIYPNSVDLSQRVMILPAPGVTVATKFAMTTFGSNYNPSFGQWNYVTTQGALMFHRDNSPVSQNGYAGSYTGANGANRFGPGDESANYFTSSFQSVALTLENTSKALTLYKNGTSIASKTITNVLDDTLSTTKNIYVSDSTNRAAVEYIYQFARCLSRDEVEWLFIEPYCFLYQNTVSLFSIPSSVGQPTIRRYSSNTLTQYEIGRSGVKVH